MTQESLKTSDYLLVPTNVQALLVGKPGARVYDLAPVPRDKDDLANWYVDSKYSFSFQNTLAAPAPGIHLHWALPCALLHAHDSGGEDPQQPCIPNRWLVLRLWHAPGASEIRTKAWVVESDYLSANRIPDSTPFLWFERDLPEVRHLGRAVDADKGWSEEHPQGGFELKSYGWGDPSFHAYYPACKGVLGFYDRMAGVETGALLTYLVLGWYSDPAKDPLHSTGGTDAANECTQRLASLGWSCAGLTNLEGAALPRRTLCHGAVLDLEWKGFNQDYPTTTIGSPTVSIGGNAAEALAALLAPGSKPLQQVLCALQQAEATQFTDLCQLGDLLHRHTFGAVPGGTLWTLEPIERTPASSPPPPISAAVQNLLRELNNMQRGVDSQQRKVDSLRTQLFTGWATWAAGQKGSVKHPNPNEIHEVLKKLGDETNYLKKLESEVESRRTNLIKTLKPETTGRQLAASTMPPFVYPKEPFVALKADNLVGVDRATAQYPAEGTEGALPCRVAQEVITGVSLSGAAGPIWPAEGDLELDLPRLTGPPLLGEVARALALETLLLDRNCPGPKTTEAASLEELRTRKSPLSGNSSAWNGQSPDPLGITRWGKHNPWLPVYLLWQVRWIPTVASAQFHSPGLVGWSIPSNDPAAPPIAADLVPPNPPETVSNDSILLEGVTIISPVSSEHLATNLEEFAARLGRKAEMTRLRQMQVLGQSLGGLNDLLLRQTLGLFLPPVDATSNSLAKAVWDAIRPGPEPLIAVNGTFLPLRAGALKLVNLFVVDTFGQTQKLIEDSSTATALKPEVVASALLPAAPSDYHAAFSPRLVQPARLNFDWRSADLETSSPVCGWVVPNFLERSFSIFSAQGAPLGALKCEQPEPHYHWSPIPGSTLDIKDIGNQWLRRFVNLVHHFTRDEAAAFGDLVDLILRRTDGRVPQEDPAIGVLLSRPLALVQASLRLEFQGLPAGYWRTDDHSNLEFVTNDIGRLRVPVRLGDVDLPSDGLIGYMAGGSGPLDPDEPGVFLASEGAQARLAGKKIRYEQDLSVAYLDPPISLTLLMEASARVHATTGILPRQSLALPAEATRLASLIQDIYIAVAPVLGERSHGPASQPVMPRPSDAFGRWSWATRPDLTDQNHTWREIRAADDRARFADELALTEGWLRLHLQRKQTSG